MGSPCTETAPSELIKDFVLARQELRDTQRAHAQAHIALHQTCLRMVNEIFDELRTNYTENVHKLSEWYILDVEEHLGKIIVVVRFATKKDIPTIPENVKHELAELYQEILRRVTERFLTCDDSFVIRAIFV